MELVIQICLFKSLLYSPAIQTCLFKSLLYPLMFVKFGWPLMPHHMDPVVQTIDLGPRRPDSPRWSLELVGNGEEEGS